MSTDHNNGCISSNSYNLRSSTIRAREVMLDRLERSLKKKERLLDDREDRLKLREKELDKIEKQVYKNSMVQFTFSLLDMVFIGALGIRAVTNIYRIVTDKTDKN